VRVIDIDHELQAEAALAGIFAFPVVAADCLDSWLGFQEFREAGS
jgi:hypothetical protein